MSVPPRNEPSPMTTPATQWTPTPDFHQVTTHYQPQFRVRIFSHDDGTAWHDLYALNDDILSVSFDQSMRNPAAQWAITLPPHRKLGPRHRKWNEIVRPMDYVEIDLRTLARDPWVTVLRGFVDNCFEADVVDQGLGRPQRRCVLNGRNFGKLWLEDKIFYLLELGQAATGLAILERYWGLSSGPYTPAQFLSEIWTKIGLPKLQWRRNKNRAIPLPLVGCSVPDEYRIYSTDNSLQTFVGPLWNLMQIYATAPYTEFLVRDMPGAGEPSVDWRWAPLLTRGNKLPLEGHGSLPTIRTLHARDITGYNVGTGDNDRYTYFYATPGQMSGSWMSSVFKGTNPGFIDGDGIWQYGFKPFEPTFNMYAYQPPGQPEVDPGRLQAEWGAELDRLNLWLADTFIWAVEMSEGSIDCALLPNIAIGEYLDVPEEGVRLYVEGVSHNIVVGQFATTRLTVTRGLPLNDPAVARPTGFDPHSDAPIPGGTVQRGPVPGATPVPVPGSEPPSIVPPQAQAGVVAIADRLHQEGVEYGWGAQGYMDGIRTGNYEAGVAGAKRTGIDCSGLVDHAYFWATGVRMPPTAQNQYNHTYRVAKENLIPGDLLFFAGTSTPNPGETVTHVGIYVGENLMINSQTSGVNYANPWDSYWLPHFYGTGRNAPGQPVGH